MTHPDKYSVGLLSMGLMVVGFVCVIVLFVVLILNSHRFMPRTRSQTVYWIGTAVMWPLMIAAWPLASFAAWHLVVIADCGWEAYADGLRLVNKHGLLSNGRFLSTFWAAAYGPAIMTFDLLTVIPFTLWHAHFRWDQAAPQSVFLSGIVRLDGEPLPRALVCFYDATGDSTRGWPTALANEAGWYAVELPPATYRVTVEHATVALPAKYADPAQTPLQFAGEQLGPVEQDLKVTTWTERASQPMDIATI
jgi:hypothetical protein